MKLLLVGIIGDLYSSLYSRLSCITEGEVYLTKDLYSAWALISEFTPDLIIVNYEAESKKNIGLIEDMKTIHPNATIVVIAGKSCAEDFEKLKNFGAGIILDETMEIEPLIELYVKVSRSRSVLETLRNKLKVLN